MFLDLLLNVGMLRSRRSVFWLWVYLDFFKSKVEEERECRVTDGGPFWVLILLTSNRYKVLLLQVIGYGLSNFELGREL